MRMIKYFLVATQLLNLISCKAQINEQSNLKKDTIMEYFDNDKYKDLPLNPKFNNRENDRNYLINNKKIRIVFYGEKIQVDERKLDSPFESFKVYFKSNNRLCAEGVSFYGSAVGISREYDIKGTLTKEINHDAPYRFSIEDLREKIKQEYDVDIVSDYRDDKHGYIKISRWLGYDKDWMIYKKNVPMYQSAVITKDNKNIYLEINAITGETISKEVNGVREIPSKAPMLDNDQPYKTYEGKTYTEAEWKVFELKLWEEHQKKNRK